MLCQNLSNARFLSVALMMKLLFFLSCLSALACIGFRLLRLILSNFLNSVVWDFFSSFSNSVILFSRKSEAGGGFQFLFLR